jgi:hypothetical protein
LPRASNTSLELIEGQPKIVFLVTPRLAHLTAAEHPFVSNALRHIFRDYRIPGNHVDVLLAVIDKVPGSWRVRESRLQSCEGVSVLIGAWKFRFPKVSSSTPLIEFTVNRPSQGALTFMKEAISIPLANTLFTTGQSSTLIFKSYDVATHRPGRQSFNLRFSGFKSLAQVQLPATRTARSHQRIPLIPLTGPRMVKEVIGNIVRELDIDGKSTPASTELEPAVLREAKRRPEGEVVDAKTRIYALIQPADTSVSLQKRFLPTMLPPISAPGLRLYEVVGGGGGWGSKVGLIALDPSELGFDANGLTTNNSSGTMTRMPPWEATDSGGKPLDGQKHAMVKRGEWLSFWQLGQNFFTPDPDDLMDSPNHVDDRDWVISVGTIPSPDSLEMPNDPASPQSPSIADNIPLERDDVTSAAPSSSSDVAATFQDTDTAQKRRRPSVIIRDREIGALSEKPILVNDAVFVSRPSGGRVSFSLRQPSTSTVDAESSPPKRLFPIDAESTPTKNPFIESATFRLTVPYSCYKVLLFNHKPTDPPPGSSSSDE